MDEGKNVSTIPVRTVPVPVVQVSVAALSLLIVPILFVFKIIPNTASSCHNTNYNLYSKYVFIIDN